MIRAVFMLIVSSMIWGCASQPESQVPMLAQPVGKTLVYECQDLEFTVRTGPGEVALYLPSDYLVLGQERAASGSRYRDGEVMLWTKGDSAMLEYGSLVYKDCQLNRARAPWEDARRRGVNFRAVGQEPGWHLEIQEGRQILFVAGYGEKRVVMPAPEPELYGERTTYRSTVDDRELFVELIIDHCADSMSGDSFDYIVRVEYNGEHYQGCGLALEQEWDWD